MDNGHRSYIYVLAGVAALMALSFAIYAQTLSFGFVYDDILQIVDNPWVKERGHLLDILTTHSFGFNPAAGPGRSYRPLVFFLYSAEYFFFGMDLRWWHLVNIALHALNASMVFIVAKLLFGAGSRGGAPAGASARYFLAFGAAAVFAAHPVNSEVVSWVGCAPELLYTLLTLCAFSLYVFSGLSGRKYLIFPSALLFFLAALAKETALGLLPLLFVYAALFEKSWRFSAKRLAPYMAAAAAYFALRLYSLGTMAPVDSMYPYLNSFQYILNACVLFVKYMAALLFTVADRPFQLLDPVFSLSEPRAAFSVALLAAGAFLILAFRRRLDPLYLLAFAIIALSLLPALYIPGLSRQSWASRYLYFPSIGFALVMSLLFAGARDAGLLRGRRWGAAALAAVFSVIVIAYSVEAWKRSFDWKDENTLWGAALAGSPGNYFALLKLGELDLKAGRNSEAIAVFDRAIGIIEKMRFQDPGALGSSRLNRAIALRAAGRYDEAADGFAGLLRENPGDADLPYELAYSLQLAGRPEEAVTVYAEVIRISKDRARVKDAYLNTGNCYAALGRYGLAMESYGRALELFPGDPAVLNNMRIIADKAGKGARGGASR